MLLKIAKLIFALFIISTLVAFAFMVTIKSAHALPFTNYECAQQWTKKNLAIELLDHTATYIDMRMTAQFPRYGLTEGSSRYFLGKHPSRNRLRNSALLYGAIHSGVSICLPPAGRKTWQALTLMPRLAAVLNNYQIGVRFDW